MTVSYLLFFIPLVSLFPSSLSAHDLASYFAEKIEAIGELPQTPSILCISQHLCQYMLSSCLLLRLTLHVFVSAFVLDPIQSHVLKKLIQLLSFHIIFFLIELFLPANVDMLLLLPLFKKQKTKKTTWFTFTTCFPIFHISFCSIIPQKTCLHLLCQIFPSHVLS